MIPDKLRAALQGGRLARNLPSITVSFLQQPKRCFEARERYEKTNNLWLVPNSAGLSPVHDFRGRPVRALARPLLKLRSAAPHRTAPGFGQDTGALEVGACNPIPDK